MAGKIKSLQTNFTSGVLDKKLAAREDITFYYNGLQDGVNGIITPQGGYKHRPGGEHVAEIKRRLEGIDLSSAVIIAPNGGTVANVKDGDKETFLVTTADLGATNGFVIAHIEFPASQMVSAIDTIDYSFITGFLNDEIFWQYSSNDMAWSNYGPAFNWDATKRSRRRSKSVSAKYWRLVRIGVTAVATKIQVGEFKFWKEVDDLSGARLIPFSHTANDVYMMVGTDRNIDVVEGREVKASIAVPYTSEQLNIVNWAQRLDTLLLYHPECRTQKVFQQGAVDEFDFRDLQRTNVPKFDFGAGVGGVDEVQALSVGALQNGEGFTILLEGERTTTITAPIANITPTNAAAIQTALRSLNNTSATGITVTAQTGYFEVTFSGEDGKQPWDAMSVSVLGGNSVWSVSRKTKGEYPGEAIISDARGYPRAGAFYNGRLHEVGMRDLPDAWLASTTSDYYDFDIDIDDDTKALLTRMDADQIGILYQVVQGRYLTFFANEGEFYNPVEPITDKSHLKFATGSGSKEGVRVFETDGALIQVQGVKDDKNNLEIGTSIREVIYDDAQQSFSANILSKLSGSLIRNPVDVAMRKALNADDADVYLMANEDGTATYFTVLRNDAVNAFVKGKTREGDNFKCVRVDKKRRVYWIVERIIDGVARMFLEIWNEDYFFDGGGIVSVQAETVAAVTAGQSEFTWSFDNPSDPEAIGVRLNGAKLSASEYFVDLDTKTITLNASTAAEVKVKSIIRIASMVKEISGLHHLNNETVSTYVDGSPSEAYQVLDGILTLADYADTEIQYGFEFEVSGSLMPFRIPNSETLSGEKIKVTSLVFNLFETNRLQYKANGRKSWAELPLQRLDTQNLDRSDKEREFSGEVTASGLLGIAVGAPVEFRRPAPGKFMVLGITREVVL